MKVIIIGKSGQLAKELVAEIPKHFELLLLGRQDIDITSLASLEEKAQWFMPQIIINASAYTAVDNAETDQDAAYLLNHLAVENIAKVAKGIGARLLHVSTDFVFDGKGNKAYTPNDTVNPCSVYGASKLAGELAIKQHYAENSAIIRTAWLYSTYGNNFVKTMIRLMNDKTELNVINDQFGCPTNAKGLAKFIWQLTTIKQLNLIYHWTDMGVASWYDFAVAIQQLSFENKLLDRKIPIKPIPSTEYPTPAERPNFSLLNAAQSYKIQDNEHWILQLTKCIKQIAKDL